MDERQPLRPSDFVAVLRTEADRMASLPIDRFDAVVPTCPGWDLADLLSHTGWVHRWFRYMLSLPEGERPTREGSMAAGLPKTGSAQRPDGALVPWFRAGVEQLVQTLEATPPTKQLNSLFGVQSPAFVARRVAHETAIHRWDAENSLGQELRSNDWPAVRPPGSRTAMGSGGAAPGANSAAVFDPSFAADGIDELLEVWVPRRFDYEGFGTEAATLELSDRDGSAAWGIAVEAGDTRWWHGRVASADVTAEGSLDDLYLSIWSRGDIDRIDVSGDRDLLARWQAAAAV